MTFIPLVYTVESLRLRWATALVAVLGIAGTVAVFIAMLALGQGFRATLMHSGSPDNAIVRRAGATSEMDSVLNLDSLHAVEDSARVARDGAIALVSPEVVVVAALPLRKEGSDANVQVRGLLPVATRVHRTVRIAEGRFLTPGLQEILVGKNAVHSYAGLEYGSTAHFGGTDWKVVGILDGGGSSFDSEIWCDLDALAQAYQRPKGIFQSLAVKLKDPSDLDSFRNELLHDRRLEVQVDGEVEYYERESQALTGLIRSLGGIVAFVMGLGAVFGALNTMYSTIAERTREVATLRAIGFGTASVLLCFVLESLLIALVGGLAGCLLVLPVNGMTTGTLNWQTFSHLAFAFQITGGLLFAGVLFGLLMGLVGGVPPALRAARLPVAAALRDL